MSRLLSLDDGDHGDVIAREIERIRHPSVLGRSDKLLALFDYLVARSRSGAPPREVEIMQDVFAPITAAADDGVGRVYVHRLRKRLAEIYREQPDTPVRIALPLGEYRLVAELGADEPREERAPQGAALPPDGRTSRRGLFAAGAATGAVAALALGWLLPALFDRGGALDEAAESAIWRPLLTNGKNVLVAEGDYYLYGEAGADGRPHRFIRDPAIPSRQELDAYLAKHPGELGRYLDGNVRYLPVSVARAQLYLSRLLLRAGDVRMAPASELTPAVMLSQNILYLGLTSGLGQLARPVAAGSRFALGPDADDIRDLKSGRVYHGQPAQVDGTMPRRQYGLVSVFSGKTANRYIVLAGISEMGLVGLAETLADPARLAELARAVGDAPAYEALYQVHSQGRGILEVRLLQTNRRDPRQIWSPDLGTPPPR